MQDNVKLDIAIEIISTKLAIAMEKKDKLDVNKLLKEREEIYLGNWNIINKVLKEYSKNVNE